MRPTPTTTPVKTKPKRRRHAHPELAAAEPVSQNYPEAPPIMAASPANKARKESRTTALTNIKDNSIECRSNGLQ
jgi:hypothetical protein